MPEGQPSPASAPTGASVGASVEPTDGTRAARDQTPRIVYNIHRDRLVAHGVLDIGFTDQLTDILAATLAEHPRQIVVDLNHVWLIDASVVRVLLAFQTQAAAAGCDLHIINAQGVVHRVLQLTGVLPPPTHPPRNPNRPLPQPDR